MADRGHRCDNLDGSGGSSRGTEHMHPAGNVYDNSESIRAETIHCARKHVVLEFPTEMFQIQSCLQNCLQRAGIDETKARRGMLQRLHGDHKW